MTRMFMTILLSITLFTVLAKAGEGSCTCHSAERKVASVVEKDINQVEASNNRIILRSDRLGNRFIP